MSIKQLIKSVPLLYKSALYVKERFNIIKPNSKYLFSGEGICYKTKIRVRGGNNSIKVGLGSCIRESSIIINGNNNLIEIDENCQLGKCTSILIEGDNHYLKIGANSTFTQYVHLCLQEYNTKIILGNDCMLSNHIIIRTSDSHSIYNSVGCRINQAADVIMGNHVWICPNATIMKGVTIGDNVIIASNALVTSNVASNVMVGGIPAKIMKRDCLWTREKLW